MRNAAIAHMLAGLDEAERIRYCLVLQCAPFLKGMRAACMLSIRIQYRGWFADVMHRAGVQYEVLSSVKGRDLVLFYRREMLSAHLGREDIREALEDMGYVSTDMDGLLKELSQRMSCGNTELREAHPPQKGMHCGVPCGYDNRCREFPHEAGLFLGYPIGDVKGFIRFGGRHCLLDGYWKVYENPLRARMTFLAYDKAKISAANEILSGKSIEEIVTVSDSSTYKM